MIQRRPKVTLFKATDKPYKSVLAAIKTCRSVEAIDTDFRIMPSDAKLIESVIKSGHTSVLEHVSFTFIVTGMSLAARSQFFRHRIMSPTEQSKRAVNALELGVVVPDSIIGNDIALGLYLDSVEKCYDTYDILVGMGIPREDARYCMPQSLETSFIVTINGRELFDSIFPDRLCKRSQWEVRDAVGQMYQIVMGMMPSVYKLTGPRCHFGKCREAERCAKEIEVKA